MADLGGETTGSSVEHAVIARYRLGREGFGGPGDRAVVREARRLLAEVIERAGVGEFDEDESRSARPTLFFGTVPPLTRRWPRCA